MQRKWRAFSVLSAHDRWVIAQCWLLLLAIDLGLRWCSFRRIQWLLKHHFRVRSVGNPQGEISYLSRLMEITARHHLYPITCLRQALALQWLLAQREIETELRIGVWKDGDVFAAHAWIEYQGAAIGQPQRITERFTPFEGKIGL